MCPGSCALRDWKVGKCTFFMAYMHELVHICHLDPRFLLNLRNGNRYHAIFNFGMANYDLVLEKDCFSMREKCPKVEKIYEMIFDE